MDRADHAPIAKQPGPEAPQGDAAPGRRLRGTTAIGLLTAVPALVALCLLTALPTLAAPVRHVDLEILTEPLLTDVTRIGVNLGHATAWGAEQLFANVLRNPGFEGTIDRTIVIVEDADDRSFTEATAWLGRADQFWRGAAYDVRTGRSAGRTGILVDSKRKDARGLPSFFTDGRAPPLEPGDVVALTRIDDSGLPAAWWVGEGTRSLVTTVRGDQPPGSAGKRALALTPESGRDAEIQSYLDAIGDRAGRLLPIRGRWRLSFWARAAEPGAHLSVRFRRIGSPAFVDQRIDPGPRWEPFVIEFDATDPDATSTLELRFAASGQGGRVLLDDVDLRSRADSGSEFRREVGAALQALRPGYLRNWQGQLGETLANSLAAPTARRASRWAPGERASLHFTYSLPAFLDLCRVVGADPWLVVPPVSSDEEWDELGRFLARRSADDPFREILIELGNENWNPVFRAGGIPDPAAHGAVAERAFTRLRAAAGPATTLRFVVNGQHANPSAALHFLERAPSADLLAVAPYFLYSLSAGTAEHDWLARLFAPDEHLPALVKKTRAIGKGLVAAEVNLHTTRGDAGADERDRVTTGAAAGVALAQHLLRNLEAGVGRQCVYTLAGYDNFTESGGDFVKLWGVVRDLGPTGRLRPTGLALSLLNRAVAGDLHGYRRIGGPADDELTVAAFLTAQGWSVAVASSGNSTAEISIELPEKPHAAPPRRWLQLQAASPTVTNEDTEDVRIIERQLLVEGNFLRFRIPAHGLAVLLP